MTEITKASPEQISSLCRLSKISCAQLQRVGPKTLALLEKCEIYSLKDLLLHFPFRYEDRSKITKLGQCALHTPIVIQAEIIETKILKGRKPTLLCTLSDGTGIVTLRFFHYQKLPPFYSKIGTLLRCYGEIKLSRLGLEMMHPECEQVKPEKNDHRFDALTAVYPATQGLSQRRFRDLISQGLNYLDPELDFQEFLPDNFLNQYHFPKIFDAIYEIHQPRNTSDIELLNEFRHPAQKRLIFDELLAQHFSFSRMRRTLSKLQAPKFMDHLNLIEDFIQKLPFTLTNSQLRVFSEIKQDLNRSIPMMRLIQGDVGSGKTIIAALSALLAIQNNFQAALMAPTEILATQHYENFKRWFSEFGIQVVLITGKLKSKERQQALLQLQSNDALMVIGTQALFQEKIDFKNLGLIIIDEQHRFGVDQRLALLAKGQQKTFMPHQLIMTATPIPRTLTMTLYADLDHSLITELPPNRQPIQTLLVSDTRRETVIQRLQKICREGQQAYWICTLIDESETLEIQAAKQTEITLKTALPGLKIALVHGKMKADEKETLLRKFYDRDIDLLIATTVIEVGIDVPNATVMVIENPERLGLAQLHQLRGRVGRGTLQSYCILLFGQPLSFHAKERLRILRESNNGFTIAERDLALRGPGEVLGTRQAGLMQFRIADIFRDKNLMEDVTHVAKQLQHEATNIPQTVIARWLSARLKFAAIG